MAAQEDPKECSMKPEVGEILECLQCGMALCCIRACLEECAAMPRKFECCGHLMTWYPSPLLVDK
jgi:hypothetical protein